MADASVSEENKGVGVKLILTLTILLSMLVWKFGIGIPDWLPFANYLSDGDWTGTKTLLLAAMIITPILVGYGAWLVYKADDSKWPQRFFYGFMGLIFAATAGNMLLSTSAFEGLRQWLKAKRDHLVSPLTAVAEGHTPASELTLKDFDLSGSNLLWIVGVILGVLLLASIMFNGKSAAKETKLPAVPWTSIMTVAIVGGIVGIVWLALDGQLRLPRVASAPAEVYTPNITKSATNLTKADYLTDKIGRLPNLHLSKEWSRPVTDWSGTCIDWNRADVVVGSRANYGSKFVTGFVPGHVQLAFKGYGTLSLERKEGAGSCT